MSGVTGLAILRAMAEAGGTRRLRNRDRWHAEHRRGDEDEFLCVTRQLERWLRGQRFELEFVRWLTEGGSGAHVAVVRSQSTLDRTDWRHLVLRLVPPATGESETERAREALAQAAPEFRSAHLITLEFDGTLSTDDEPWWIHLQRVALDDLGPTRAPRLVDVVDDEGYGAYCRTIVRSLLDDWNAGSDIVTYEPHTFLEGFLGGVRLTRPRITAFLDEAGISLDAPRRHLTVPGRAQALPSPFALLAGNQADWPTETDVFLGRSHGDLHVRNVLLPRSEERVEAERFQLIDLGHYDGKGPLSHDPMRLLLSTAAEWLPGLVPHSAIRSGLAELMVTPLECPAPAPLAGYRAVAREIHRTALDWAAGRHSAPSDWRRQNHLVLAGLALRYAAREELDPGDRWWFVEVAALATRAFVDGADPRGENLTTSPTEVCAENRRPLPHPAAPSPAPDGQPVVGKVLRFPRPPREAGKAAELAALLADIDRLPADASGPRLLLLAHRLCERATHLADSLTGLDSRLLRNQLLESGNLVLRLDATTPPPEILRLLRRAGRRLRGYGHELWPDEVG
ncbi:hypothetical protein ACWGJ2_02125 [Streptomyces sp. NPDC054796]